MIDPTVFVVDDDREMRNSLRRLLKTVHLNVELYASAQDFLDRYKPEWPGCIILDMRMPGMSGLALQEKLVDQGIKTPIIIVTGHGDISMAVKAVKGGAFEFIQKPFNDQVLLDCVNKCIALDSKIRQEAAQREDIRTRMAQLTAREREVLELIVDGQSNKMVAARLNVSCKTVEAHRAKVMAKMQASSLTDLVKLHLTLQGRLTSPSRCD